MDIFDGLSALGGLCLFLFGMSIMAEALQRRAGGQSVKNVHVRLLSRLACPGAAAVNRSQTSALCGHFVVLCFPCKTPRPHRGKFGGYSVFTLSQ